MRKIFITLTLTLLLMGCVFASNSTLTINDVDFNIPSKYQGGKIINDNYRLDNIFSIRCIDEDVPKAVGFWATEKDFSKDLMIEDHPVRHYGSYNEGINGNLSHAYFASGESIYEIKWAGSEITPDIENLIKNTPSSKISEDEFYSTLDKSVDIYKEQKIERLNRDSEYNYLEAKYHSQSQQDTHDDRHFKEILITYYNG